MTEESPTVAEISHKLTMLARYHSDHREAEAVAEAAVSRLEELQQRVRDLEAAMRGILDATGGLSREATVGAREAIYADLRKLGVVAALGGAGDG